MNMYHITNSEWYAACEIYQNLEVKMSRPIFLKLKQYSDVFTVTRGQMQQFGQKLKSVDAITLENADTTRTKDRELL